MFWSWTSCPSHGKLVSRNRYRTDTTAIVVPLHKYGDASSSMNYRPISILSVISKLAEKEVRQQIIDRRYLTSNSILSPTQFAYRLAHSSESAMLNTVRGSNKNTGNGLVTSLVECIANRSAQCQHDFIVLIICGNKIISVVFHLTQSPLSASEKGLNWAIMKQKNKTFRQTFKNRGGAGLIELGRQGSASMST